MPNKWTKWKGSIVSESGDIVELEYRDYYARYEPDSPNEYDIEYISMTVNGEPVDLDDIENTLDSILSSKELETLYYNAKVDNDDP